MSTLKTTNLQNASAASPAFVLAADGSATANLSSVNGGALSGMRNRILNGDMRLDQRFAGTTQTALGFSVDRWFTSGAGGTGIYSSVRSTTAPTGFTNSLLLTVTTADTSIVASDLYYFGHSIEGYNVADLGLGTADAKSFTLSFWVRSSIAGTYAVRFANSAANRSYVAQYTINAANTFEYKTITVAGDTSGTWLTDNSLGLNILWALGAGSTWETTAGSWTAGNFVSTSAATEWVSTSGATFYITGVQLEPGSTATPFERRSFGQELALCQRYYWKTYNIGTVPGSSAVYAGTGAFMLAPDATTSNCHRHFPFGFLMRATPTIVGYSPNNGNTSNPIYNSGPNANIGWNPFNVNERSFGFHMTSSVNATSTCYVHFTCSAEL